jgi:hypothetical protein
MRQSSIDREPLAAVFFHQYIAKADGSPCKRLYKPLRGTIRLTICSPGSNFCSGSGSFSVKVTSIVTRCMLAPDILPRGFSLQKGSDDVLCLPWIVDKDTRNCLDFGFAFSAIASLFVQLAKGSRSARDDQIYGIEGQPMNHLLWRLPFVNQTGWKLYITLERCATTLCLTHQCKSSLREGGIAR